MFWSDAVELEKTTGHGGRCVRIPSFHSFPSEVTDLFALGEGKCCAFEFIITGGKPGHSSHDLQCKITNSAEPVVLHVEADFKVGMSTPMELP